MKLTRLMSPERILDLRSTDKQGALDELLDVAARAEEVTDRDALAAAIRERESILSTGIGLGIAVPHAKIEAVTDFVVVMGRSRAGLDFDSIDGKPVNLVVLIGASSAQKDEYVKVLAKVAHLLKRQDVRQRILDAPGPQEIYDIVRAESA